jgi:hypothetical protein
METEELAMAMLRWSASCRLMVLAKKKGEVPDEKVIELLSMLSQRLFELSAEICQDAKVSDDRFAQMLHEIYMSIQAGNPDGNLH